MRICNYCNIKFYGSGRQFGAHKTNCKENPKWEEIHQKQIDSITLPRIKFKEYCKKCGSKYFVLATESEHRLGKYHKTCSKQCAKANNQRYDRTTGNCLYCNKKFDINSKWNKKYCNSKCQQEFNYILNIKNWKDKKIIGGNGPDFERQCKFIRRYIFEKFDNKCSECGWNKINTFTGKIPLQIHHIDGNSRNHSENNLQLLCPSCHSLTQFFGSKNNGNGRKRRYLKK